MSKPIVLASILATLAGTAAAAAASPAEPASRLSARAERGLVLAQQRCSACHGVTANTSSPNPESPPFEDIANKEGLTRTTLQRFLRDSHNYPEAMNFTIKRSQARDLAEYFLSLRRPAYKPSI